MTELVKPDGGAFVILPGDALMATYELADQLKSMVGKSGAELMAAAGSIGSVDAKPSNLVLTDDGFAVISLRGVILRYDCWISSIMGWPTVDGIIGQLQDAITNPMCKGVLLLIDSPGGVAAAIHDMSDLIFQMRGSKPVVAYVDNSAGSAAYWPASACNQIVMSPAAFVGSIGVVAAYYVGKDPNVLELVSSQSPKKRPDLSTDDGRNVLQSRLDDLAQVFIDNVAKHRGVDPALVQDEFGMGDMVIASKAVAAGMADKVGDCTDAFNTLKALAADVASDPTKFGRTGPGMTADNGVLNAQGDNMEVTTVEQLTALNPGLVTQMLATAKAEGATAERSRIQAIDTIDTPENRAIAGDLITASKYDGKTSHEALAYQIMSKSATLKTEVAGARKEDSANIPDLGAGGGGEGQDAAKEAAATAARMAAFGSAHLGFKK